MEDRAHAPEQCRPRGGLRPLGRRGGVAGLGRKPDRPPQIAIVDLKGMPTQKEFELFREYFEAQGHPSVIASPDELEFRKCARINGERAARSGFSAAGSGGGDRLARSGQGERHTFSANAA